jgi:hypothetical protein
MFGALLLAAAPASAAPRFLPDQDVTVRYEVDAPGRAAADYRLMFDAPGRLARVENADASLVVLADLGAGQAQLYLPALHAVVEAPDFSALTGMIANAGGARFTPLGHGFYAGLGCEKYLVLATQGSGEACLTADGVVLHFSGHDAHGAAEVTALSVSFGQIDPAAFALPPQTSQITLPPGALAALLQNP